MKKQKLPHSHGFTLIELSVVLVIIGLIVGGVLVGQSLISAAAVRAQISQIEKYNTAANTFKGNMGISPETFPTRLPAALDLVKDRLHGWARPVAVTATASLPVFTTPTVT
jgi:prepilin-type N-terminal cleavage/methylation domain-containing protein